MHRNFLTALIFAYVLAFTAPVAAQTFLSSPPAKSAPADQSAQKPVDEWAGAGEWTKKTVLDAIQAGVEGEGPVVFSVAGLQSFKTLLNESEESLRRDMDKWQSAKPEIMAFRNISQKSFLPSPRTFFWKRVELCHDVPLQEKTGYEMEGCLDVSISLPPEKSSGGGYLITSVSHEALSKLRHSIGSLGVAIKDAGGYFLVSRVFDELRRQKNPMKMLLRGDVLLEIDGASVSGLSLDAVEAKIFGAPGSDVTVHVRRSEVSNDLELKLARINMSDQEALFHAEEALTEALTASFDAVTEKKKSMSPFFSQTSWDELQVAVKDEGPRLSKIIPEIVRKPAWCTISSKSDPHIPQSWDFSCGYPLPDTSDDDVVFGRDQEVLSFTLSRVPKDQSPQGLAVSRFKSGLVTKRRIDAISICESGDTGAFQRDKFGGVGIGMELESCVFRAAHIYEGAPAERAGVKEGDLVVAVDGVPLMGLTLQEMMVKVRGDAGTEVTLTVLRKHEKGFLTFKIKREIITAP